MKTPESGVHFAAKINSSFSFRTITIFFFFALVFSLTPGATNATTSITVSDSTGIRELRYSGSIGLFGQVAGPEVVGGYVNIFLAPVFSINAGAGISLAYHFGANVYLARNPRMARLCPYVGFQRVSVLQINILGESDERQAGWYLPLGVEYITKKRFSMQLEMGPNFFRKNFDQYNTDPFLVTFRIGGYFYTKKK